MIKRILPIGIIIFVVVIFFRMFFLRGLLPIPTDVMVGLYHPFRDFYAAWYPRGIPYKNFLLADPIEQQYPWRELGMHTTSLPLWNPYQAAGMPLLANHQSGILYPLNILFLLPGISFGVMWSILIFLAPVLAAIGMYCYLRNLNMSGVASLLGGITFSFSGFFVSWLEWGNIPHTVWWTPIILLSIDKINESDIYKKIRDRRIQATIWYGVFVIALCSSFLAGHAQSFFYVVLLSLAYWIARFIHYPRHRVRRFLILVLSLVIIVLLTIAQWYPTLSLISWSARDLNGLSWLKEGWFVPWAHLAQFIAPDFFGNPATLNYWGVWNYGEMVGYVGIVPLLFALFAVLTRHDMKTRFFSGVFFLALLFALPTGISSLPFILKIPFISTAQPTRLIFLVDFSLSILAALGIDYYLRDKKPMRWSLLIVGCLFSILLGITLLLPPDHAVIAKHNLVLSGLYIFLAGLACVLIRKTKHNQWFVYALVLLTCIDLVHFANKYDPFTKQMYLYPKTAVLSFLESHAGNNRIMTTDKRILPPNIPVHYHLQSIEGYDPLLLRNYVDFTTAIERRRPDITPLSGFNRIVTPHEYDSRLIDLMGVKYILSLDELTNPKLTKVFEEGQTKIYENSAALPRTFFVQNSIARNTRQEVIDAMFDSSVDIHKTAILMSEIPSRGYSLGTATITLYQDNRVSIATQNSGEGFLLLTDAFYPTWQATIDENPTHVYQSDFMFRGIVVPAGKHTIVFSDKLF